jgi:two-component system KDP operon response regulator KdpE
MGDLATILIIEDSQEIVEALTLALKIRWPEANIVSTDKGEQGIKMVEDKSPDMCILDLGLPDISGFDVLKAVRLFSVVPIIILSVRGDEKDVFKGLELGADDYIVKPFRHLELLGRVKAVLRRRVNCAQKQPIICGAFRLSPAEQIISYKDNNVCLTHTECIILAELMLNAGRVVSHASLAEELWGNNFIDAARSLKVYIWRLRQKLEPNPELPIFIITKPGLGYLFLKAD